MRDAIVIIYSRGVLQPSGIRRFGNGVSQLSPSKRRLKSSVRLCQYISLVRRGYVKGVFIK